MRELHVVATSEDGRHVVLATTRGASKGDFKVAIDDRLTAAVRGDLPRPGETEPAMVTPKEIQARLRAGETQEEIAASAGVPLAKIERYAGPVLSEIERVLDQARAGFVSRSRLGESALPLGEAVDRHLADTVGVRLETVAWTARREEVGTWLVELTYVSQARRRTATWRYDVAHREVTPTDANSAALAHVEPGHRRSRVAADTDLVAATPARRPAAPAQKARAARPVKARKAPVAKAPAAPRTAVAKATKVTTVRAVAPRPPVRAAAPVPHAAAPARAAQTAVDTAALARAARAEAARVAAQEKAAKKAAEKAAREAAAAEAAAAEQAREAERRAAAEAARQAKAAAAKKAAAKAAAEKRAAEKAAAEKAAAKKAAAAKAAAEKRAAEKKAAAEKARKAEIAAEKKAAAEKARKAELAAEKKAAAEKAAADKAAADKAAAEKAAADKAAAEAARAAEVPPGPPTLRVVGSEDAPVRRGPKEPPAAARTAPARAAGQRASVPGWADVLLSTAPVARSAEPEPDPDQG